MARTPYEVLGVSNDADDSAVRAAYARKLEALRDALARGNRTEARELDAIRAAYESLRKSRSDSARAPEMEAKGGASKPDASRTPPQARGVTHPRDRRIDARGIWQGRLPPGPMLAVFLATALGLLGAQWAWIGNPLALLRFVSQWPIGLVYGIDAAFMLIVAVATIIAWKSQAFARTRGATLAGRATVVLASAIALVPLALHFFGTVALVSLAGLGASALHKTAAKGLADAACDRELTRMQDDAGRLAVLARCGDLRGVSRLVDGGANVNQMTSAGTRGPARSPLMHAISEDRIEVASYLLKRGARATDVGKDGETALHIAAGKGYPHAVRLLLANRADPNASHWLGSPLHAAVVQGDLESVRLLLASGANPNLRTQNSLDTPLHRLASIVTVRPHHPAIVEALTHAGADYTLLDSGGRTPIQAMRPVLAEKVFDQGARIPDNAPAFDAWSVALRAGDPRTAIDRVAGTTSVKARNHDGGGVMHAAILLDDEKVGLRLLELGAPHDETNNKGVTPLTLATRYCRPEIVEALLRRGARIAPLPGATVSPAHALSEYVDVRKEPCRRAALSLLDHDWPPAIGANQRGFTMLHSLCGDSELCERVLKRGVDPNARDNSGATPLHEVVRRGYPTPSVVLLLAAGANVNAQDQQGRTPLHVIADDPTHEQRMEMARRLLLAGARPQIDDRNGSNVAKHFAQKWGDRTGDRLDEFRALVEATVSVRAEATPKGRTVSK